MYNRKPIVRSGTSEQGRSKWFWSSVDLTGPLRRSQVAPESQTTLWQLLLLYIEKCPELGIRQPQVLDHTLLLISLDIPQNFSEPLQPNWVTHYLLKIPMNPSHQAFLRSVWNIFFSTEFSNSHLSPSSPLEAQLLSQPFCDVFLIFPP